MREAVVGCRSITQTVFDSAGLLAEKESCAHFKRHADSLLYIATIFIPSYITDINSLKWVSGFACRDGVGEILPTHEEYGDVHLKLI